MAERAEKNIPAWAKRERRADLAWIRENVAVFWPLARTGYQEMGRGAMVVDTITTITHPEGVGHPFGYLPRAAIDRFGDEDTQRMVKEYEPTEEFVTTLLKTEQRVSSYRFRVVNKTREDLGRRLADDP